MPHAKGALTPHGRACELRESFPRRDRRGGRAIGGFLAQPCSLADSDRCEYDADLDLKTVPPILQEGGERGPSRASSH